MIFVIFSPDSLSILQQSTPLPFGYLLLPPLVYHNRIHDFFPFFHFSDNPSALSTNSLAVRDIVKISRNEDGPD